MNLRKDHYRFVVSNNALDPFGKPETVVLLDGLFSRGLSAVSQRLGVPGLAGPQGGFRSLLRGSLGRAGPTLEWGRRPPRRTHPAGDSRCLASLGARAGDGSKSLRVLKSSPPPWLFFRYLSHNSLVVERKRVSVVALPAAFAGGRSIELVNLQKRKQL